MNDKIGPETEGLDAAVYLRKSRMEEGMATDEVLAKHQKTLHDYAASHGLHILEEYPEVVSGESLYARPQMLRLLQDVEEGKYDAVLCMDLDRLSRGRMKDQGIVLDAFRESGTLIITPEKIYNLADEIDEEYAELKTFISRREYKIITKRLRRGLQMSIQDGCYVANAPYGYHKTVVDRKPTLEIYEPEARFVRMMFELYAKGYGCVPPCQRPGSSPPPVPGVLPQQRGQDPAQSHLYREDRLEPEKAYPQGRPGQPEAHHDLPAPGPVDHHRGDPPGHRGPCALRPGPGGHGWPVSAGAERWHCTQSPGRSGQVCQLPPEYAAHLSALYPARLLRVHQD